MNTKRFNLRWSQIGCQELSVVGEGSKTIGYSREPALAKGMRMHSYNCISARRIVGKNGRSSSRDAGLKV